MNPTLAALESDTDAGGRPQVGFEPASHALTELLACRVGTLVAERRLRARWKIVLRPSGSHRALSVLEPDTALDPDDGLLDLDVLARDLPTALPLLARERLALLWKDAGLDEAAFDGLLSLTPREREILVGFLQGRSIGWLARHHFVSPHTVRNHLKHVAAKLEVSSQVELREKFAALDGAPA